MTLKALLPLTLSLLFLFGVGWLLPLQAASPGPLEIPATANWKITFSGDKEDVDYNLRKTVLETSSCTLTHVSKPDKYNIDEIAKAQGKKVEPFSGKTFQGKAVRNSESAVGLYISFTITDGKETWYGIFAGPEGDWAELRKILGETKPRS